MPQETPAGMTRRHTRAQRWESRDHTSRRPTDSLSSCAVRRAALPGAAGSGLNPRRLFSHVWRLEVRSAWHSRPPRGLSPRPADGRLLAPSTWSRVPSSSYKDTSQIGFRSTRVASFLPNHLFKGPVTKRTLRDGEWEGVRASACGFWEMQFTPRQHT